MAEGMDYSRSITESSDEVKVIFCEPCEQDGRQTEAEGFCVDCPEYLCGQCYKNHKLSKASRNHVLKDKHTMPQTVKDVGVKDICITKCDLHIDKVIEYFCQSCDKLGCTTCITLNHRQCDHVEHIPKLVNVRNINHDLQDYLTKIDDISQQVQTENGTLNSMPAIADDMRKVAKSELTKQRTEINKFFDNLEKKMENKIDEIHASNATNFKEASTTFNTMDKHLKEVKTNIDVKQKAGQQCEAFITMKQSSRGTKDIEKQLQSLQNTSEILQYEVLPSSQIRDMMKSVTEICRMEMSTPETKEIPGIKDLQTPTSKSPSQTSDISSNTSSSSAVASNIKALTFNTEIFVNTDNDKTFPSITDLILTNKHFIVVADRPNKTVKVVDLRKQTVISEIKVDKEVWSLAKINEHKIAVGVYAEIQILSISKSGSLKTEVTISTITTSIGIAYSNDKLFVADGSRVKILTMDGKVLRTIQTDSMGKPLFTYCVRIAISKDHQTIYVSDYGTGAVTSLTLDGNIKAVYKDKNLKNPWGITVDDEDIVYVCSIGNNSIHRLSPTCNLLQVFQDVSVKAVYYNENKLFVGSYKSIKIYDIK